MPLIRNASRRDLWVAGQSFAAGEVVEVGPNEAEILLTNPNFTAADDESGSDAVPADGSDADGSDAAAVDDAPRTPDAAADEPDAGGSGTSKKRKAGRKA